MRSASGLPKPLTEQAQTIDQVWTVFLVGAAAVGGLILILLVVIAIRFRRRSERLPEQVHYRIPLEVAYTVIPFMAIAGLLAVTLVSLDSVQRSVPDPDLVVEVEGFQWQWQFHYPDGDVTLSPPADSGTPELVLPRGRTVEFRLESRDVIHSFWVPGFLYKRDVIPGEHQSMQVAVSGDPGSYPAACAEFCGLGTPTCGSPFASWSPTTSRSG